MPEPPEPPDPHANFRRAVADSRLVDPMTTLRRLSETTGIPVDDLVHHALARWASAGSEALLFVGPDVLRELVAARRAGDWDKVAGIVDWLEAGWEQAAGAAGVRPSGREAPGAAPRPGPGSRPPSR